MVGARAAPWASMVPGAESLVTRCAAPEDGAESESSA
jgi:hypothetical protein